MHIETERLILREFVLDDWPDGGAVDRRELVERFVTEQARQPRRSFQLAITLKAGGRLIGNAGIRLRRLVDYGIPDATFEADMGYELDPGFWGHGYATEAGGAMMQFAFDELKVHRVWAYCLAENESSWRVMERLGFQREGHLRENEWMRGRWWDTYIYGMLNPLP